MSETKYEPLKLNFFIIGMLMNANVSWGAAALVIRLAHFSFSKSLEELRVDE
jgi:hypothetical protein